MPQKWREKPTSLAGIGGFVERNASYDYFPAIKTKTTLHAIEHFYEQHQVAFIFINYLIDTSH